MSIIPKFDEKGFELGNDSATSELEYGIIDSILTQCWVWYSSVSNEGIYNGYIKERIY